MILQNKTTHFCHFKEQNIEKKCLINHLLKQGTTTFIGCRPRNRDVLQRRMYRNEIDVWMKEADQEEKRNQRLDVEEHVILSTDHVIMGASGERRTNDVIR